MSASVRDQMPKPSYVSCQLGSPTTTRFTRTRLLDIVHPVSSSQLTQDPDRVRSFGGYNRWVWVKFYFRSHSRLCCSRLPPLRPRHLYTRHSHARLSARAPLVGVAASLSAKPR